MSIKDLNAAQAKANQSEQLPESQLHNDAQEPVVWYKRLPGRRKGSITPQPSYLPLLFCLLTAVVVRGFIVIHTQGFVDGDEAFVGIQAEHILRGELPIYFYNQPYMGSVGPRILSGELPGENAILIPLHIPTFVLSGLCILATVTLVAISFVKPHPLLLKVRKLTALPIVFASSVGIIFCLTETAANGLVSCQLDYAGRYATPLMLVVPFFVATIVRCGYARGR